MNQIQTRPSFQPRLHRFIKDVFRHTPFIKLVFLQITLWVVFSGGVYIAELQHDNSGITSYGDALYWGVAAFSTAGIATPPVSVVARFIGAVWMVVGSTVFFGTIVATVTTYFMRPMQRPHRQIIDTIEYNLEQLNELDLDELDLLRDTVDTLISHVEGIKQEHPVRDEG